MPTINALHGRERMKRAGRKCRQVLVLVLLTFAILKLEQLARINAALAVQASQINIPWSSLVVRWSPIVLLASAYAIGGAALDRIGLKPLVGVLLACWCGLLVLGTTTDPLLYLLLAPLATNLLPGVVLTAAFFAVRMSMPTRRRGPAIALIAIAFDNAWSAVRPYDLYRVLFGKLSADDPTSWQYPMFALATFGALILAAWLLALPETEAVAGLDLRPKAGRSATDLLREAAHLLADPMVWGLAAIQFCSTFVFAHALDQTWTFDLLRQGAIDTSAIVTILTVPPASIAAAGLSDWVFRRTRSFVRARRPFIVVGFLSGGCAPPLAASLTRDRIAVIFIAALGLAAMNVTRILIADLAPRRIAGTYIGTVLAIGFSAQVATQLAFATGALPHTATPAASCILAMAGALASAILIPLMRHQDDAGLDRERLSHHF